MNRRIPALSALVALSSALLLAGCGEPLSPPSEVNTLRVLGVRADTPFSPPGSRPDLDMLVYDGAPGAVLPDGSRRQVQVVWIEGCVNPPGDVYYACYPVLNIVASYLTDAALAAQTAPPGLPVGFGTSYQATLPDDIISSRRLGAGVVHPYGTSFVFFAACGGELRKRGDADPMKDFPLGCYRPGSDELLGATDFLYGYFPLYSFETLKNNNPSVAGVAFDGKQFQGGSCTADQDCAPGEACGLDATCIPVVASCSAKKADDCPEHVLRPLVDSSSVEAAVTASVPDDKAPSENLWVTYYSDAGSWVADGFVINDPSQGYRNDFDGKWRAHRVGPGQVRLWAVVRDNREGVSWVWQDVQVR